MRDLAGRLAERGLHLLDLPVSGGAAAAEAGEPTIMASGPAGSLRRRRSGARGRRQDGPQLGAAPGIGSTIEAVNQLLAGINLVIAAEGMAFGVALGADPKVLYEGDPRRRRRLLNVR